MISSFKLQLGKEAGKEDREGRGRRRGWGGILRKRLFSPDGAVSVVGVTVVGVTAEWGYLPCARCGLSPIEVQLCGLTVYCHSQSLMPEASLTSRPHGALHPGHTQA